MEYSKTMLFSEYYENWIAIYKEGAIREITMMKYKNSLRWIKQLAPDLTLNGITRSSYQQLINNHISISVYFNRNDYQ